MKKYCHLSLLEREKLFAWREVGLSLREIGRRLGRDHSGLSLEIKRQTKYGKVYYPCLAQRRSERIGFYQRWHAPLKDPLIFLYVREHLRLGWSPEQIAGRLPIDHPGCSVDKETIYRYVYHRRNQREKLWQYLALARRRRMKKVGRRVKRLGRISGAVSIDLRPKIVNRRKQFGHFESDNLEGVRSDREVVSVTIERQTRKVYLAKLANRKSATKARSLINHLSNLPEEYRRTLTLDNGAENSRHLIIRQVLGIEVYFCHAYSAWEKGTVENTIGRLRRFLPKGESLEDLDKNYLEAVEERFNNLPRKCLGFLTPNEVEAKILKASKDS